MSAENLHASSPTIEHLRRVEENFHELLRLANNPVTRNMSLVEAMNRVPSIAAGHGTAGGSDGVPVVPAREDVPPPVDEVVAEVVAEVSKPQPVYFPDGYELPSDDLAIAQEQYRITAVANERLGRALREAMDCELRFEVRPPQSITAMLILYPTLAALADAAKAAEDCGAGMARMEVPLDIALALRLFFERHAASVVAVSEFFAYIASQIPYDSPVAKNLAAAGLLDVFAS